MENITTIVIEKELRDKLKEMGKKGDSYNDIIKRLLKDAAKL
jgi:predicted CopG family antitoxin